jgi:hypothetical protein
MPVGRDRSPPRATCATLPAMRRTLALLPLLAACDGDRVLLHHSVIPGAVDGIALGADEDDLHVQRPDGTLRRVATRNGRGLETFDPQPGQTERLLALDESQRTVRVLAASEDALFVWQGGVASEPLRAEPGGGEGVVHGAFFGGGLAIVRPPQEPEEGDPACGIELWVDGEVTTHALAEIACTEEAALTADPAEPVAWVTSSEGAWLVTPDAVTVLPDATGDLATFDRTTGSAILSTRDGDTLDAWTAEGEPLWEETVELVDVRIQDISTLGASGLVAVATRKGVGGTISLLDSTTGDGLVATGTPVAGRAISGGDGTMVALSIGTEVHTFLVRVGGAP